MSSRFFARIFIFSTGVIIDSIWAVEDSGDGEWDRTDTSRVAEGLSGAATLASGTS